MSFSEIDKCPSHLLWLVYTFCFLFLKKVVFNFYPYINTEWWTSFWCLSPGAWLEYYPLINLLYSTSSCNYVDCMEALQEMGFLEVNLITAGSFSWPKTTILIHIHSYCCCCTTTNYDKATWHSAVLLPALTAQQKRHMLRTSAGFLPCYSSSWYGSKAYWRISGH